MKKQAKVVVCAVVSSLILAGFSGCSNVNKQAKAVSNIPVASDKKQEEQPVKVNIEVSEKKIVSENDYLKTSLQYPSISGMKDKSIETKLNQMFEKSALDFQKSIEESAKSGYEEYLKDKSIPFYKYEAVTEYTVTYNKNNILSIKMPYYQFTGGAHGGTNQIGYNIDLNTGKVMLLSDLFEKDFDYKTFISTEILNTIKKGENFYFEDFEKVIKGIDKNRSYYIEDGNVVIYYGQYEIAPYAAGMPEFRIPFSKLKLRADLGLIK
jgi:hypothetical protein